MSGADARPLEVFWRFLRLAGSPWVQYASLSLAAVGVLLGLWGTI